MAGGGGAGRREYDPTLRPAEAATTRATQARGDTADGFARPDACGAEPELVAQCKQCLSPDPVA
ncbi:MAG TPA: hypothetical protein VH092_38230 [Urbifossiella sp.]|nr:hypothetical protein [Urbifossiella sp.]